MATSTNGGNGAPTPAAPPEQPQQLQMQFRVLAQYTKDFSFENPNAPHSMQQQQQPQISIQINVNPKQLSNTDFEVELKLDGKAEANGSVLFAFDLTYAGVFHLQGIPQESIGPLVMIECPRLLFPFAAASRRCCSIRSISSHSISSGSRARSRRRRCRLRVIPGRAEGASPESIFQSAALDSGFAGFARAPE